ncbi:MAG TPA: T9SS type A sorting domain-containing protein [Hymenobacter sp.]|jgi:hypothetical protein|uniref:DUF7619 domain-containing protein n=1 Tax=Hymenobacter sp. TaxID=1898978 RepID=UPI002ED96164
MKFLRYALLVMCLLVAGMRPAAAQGTPGTGPSIGQSFEWAQLVRTLREFPQRYAQATTTDLAGNTYASVGFRDSVRVGGQRYTATGAADLLVKFDSTGHVAWAKPMRGLSFDQGGLKVNPATGDLFLSGQLLPGATWDGTPVPGGGPNAFFYGKCSPTGTLLWSNLRPALALLTLATDHLGNLYIAGKANNNTSQIGGFGLDSTSLSLVQVNGAGVVQWLRKLRGDRAVGAPNGGIGLTGFSGLGPKPGGGVLVLGRFQSSLYFHSGTTPVQTGGQQGSNFVASVDASGALQWSRPLPIGIMNAATADAAGNYYVTGAFYTLNPQGFLASGIGVAKYNSAGAEQWRRTEQSDTTSYAAGRQIAVDGAGNVTVLADGFPYGSARFRTRIGSLVLNAVSNVVHFNSLGQEQWVANDAVPGAASNAMRYVYGTGVGLDGRGNVYYTSQISNDTLRRQPVVQFGAQTVIGAGVIVTRIGTQHNTVAGRLYLDQNGNGVRDAGEGPFPVPVVVQAAQASSSLVATTSATGSYELFTGSGTYSAGLPQVPVHYTLSQPASGTHTGSFAGYGRLDSAKHFGIRPLANQADLRVTLTPYGAARPGFTARYRLTVENVGTTTVANGTAAVTLDSRLLYVSSTLNGSRAGQTVTWTYANLAPFGRRDFDVMFSLPTNIALGTQLSSTATAPLTGDATLDDNSATALQTVTGSFDPNDITVNHSRLTPAQVAAGLPLDYTIRFQNMGTDTAFTVVITDTLDHTRLNLGTMELIAQSHNCMWSLSGRGLLTVRFRNIELPHRTQDVIRSQGFVRFRVRPRTTLALGDIVPNEADIFFDYNDPVRTNTATTTVFLATAVLNRRDAPTWDAYPNPATDLVTVAADLATAGPVRIELLDVLGRPVRQQTFKAPAGALRQTLDLRGLASGLYVLRLTPPTGPASSRQVVRE